MAKDKFHNIVREALKKDGWIITHDPYNLKIDDTTHPIDLGAEQPIGAEWNGEKMENVFPKTDIVLGLQPPEYRQFTEHAVA